MPGRLISDIWWCCTLRCAVVRSVWPVPGDIWRARPITVKAHRSAELQRSSICPGVELNSCLVLIKCSLCGHSQGMWLCSLARFLHLHPQHPYWGVGANQTTRQCTHMLCREAEQKVLELASALPPPSSEIKGRLRHVFTSLKCSLLQVRLLEEFLIFIKFKISNQK